MTTTCPECFETVTAPAEPVLHEILECAECRGELEVVSTAPLLVALAPEVAEDWGE
ncbi:lysine biosynthesis protein LysW [Phytohabitans sp. ZYX-F-186]|uniref:Lysine biosynthesis protein LysW n=2 Tax=Micromonosporaceae TaxID=28056 RepID=A0ABU0ZDR5_9ACTN|nr:MULTISPECIES: lysine biosynthesis protein LysW [Micromonosporaceae]MDQ7905187.1 lysine biosynthesis protein LysW [Phytohabitans sp. ZYX-F-186]MDW5322265.1 lysine biosynthesis protein LysW [Plantactinospora sp. KLBMP9567]GIG94010.1 lysine biosynthesis protein LysW [Plantactinospora mayteni]